MTHTDVRVAGYLFTVEPSHPIAFSLTLSFLVGCLYDAPCSGKLLSDF